MSNLRIFLMIAVMALVTVFTRFLPFLLLKSGKKLPPRAEKVLHALPGASMGMLVVYCLKDLDFASPQGSVPAMIACLVTAAAQHIRKNSVLSIVLGTAAYMILLKLI